VFWHLLRSKSTAVLSHLYTPEAIAQRINTIGLPVLVPENRMPEMVC
jgi:hypothetical protein